MRNLLIVFLGVSVSLFAQTSSWAGESNSTDVTQVQADVSAILRGVYGNDAETVMRYTHDTIISLLGGKDKALATTRQSLSQVVASGISIEKLEFPAAPVFIRTSGSEYVLVPTKMVLVSKGKRVESLNYQFGVRKIGESQWKYVEGSRITPTNVQTFFPGFPKDQKLPETYRKLIE